MQRQTHPPLPPFWANDVEKWFKQAEEQFRLSNVHLDDAKYALIRQELPEEVVRLLWDQLYINRPTENMYETLKTGVIRVTTILTDQEKEEGLLPGIDIDVKGEMLLKTGWQQEHYE